MEDSASAYGFYATHWVAIRDHSLSLISSNWLAVIFTLILWLLPQIRALARGARENGAMRKPFWKWSRWELARAWEIIKQDKVRKFFTGLLWALLPWLVLFLWGTLDYMYGQFTGQQKAAHSATATATTLRDSNAKLAAENQRLTNKCIDVLKENDRLREDAGLRHDLADALRGLKVEVQANNAGIESLKNNGAMPQVRVRPNGLEDDTHSSDEIHPQQDSEWQKPEVRVPAAEQAKYKLSVQSGGKGGT